MDDCSIWQAVWLEPTAVRRVPGPAPRITGWATLVAQRHSTPPVEQPGYRSPQWEAAAGVALAHLLVASAGAPVALPGGLLTDMFGRELDALLPPGRPTRTAALTGPGLPFPEDRSRLPMTGGLPRDVQHDDPHTAG
ncbi:hypothetical protein AQI88_14120 [Streptomyces cellostaticus]|uniref:Uncharacterized protein n=2 Tax=Streptomyces cellostaticus TaxID=67285 RepID=A0A101NMW7_9ACTN|nr:hypothetical protein AQI88_14120 [Streptomyces cellostaticus]